MKHTVFCLLLGMAASVCRAQSLSTEQKAFLDALNQLVTITTQHHWKYDEPMQVDSLFHLNGDTLSITWICTPNGSQTRARLVAPFSKIKSVDWDDYLVLNCQDEKAVRVYEQTNLNAGWQLIEQTHLLHVGIISEKRKKEMKMKERIEKAFARIKQQPY